MRLIFLLLFSTIFNNLNAQDKVINGKVSDENNEGLPGATIIIKGTTKGTVTDIEGNFQLDVDENDIIEISFSGYEKQEISVTGKNSFSINLEPDVETLKEVLLLVMVQNKKLI